MDTPARAAPAHPLSHEPLLLKQKASSGGLTRPRGLPRLWEKLEAVWAGNSGAWEHKVVRGSAWAQGGHVPVGRGTAKISRGRGPPSALGQRSQDPGCKGSTGRRK